MAGQGQHRWVVLLNRSPKGPLTEEEVKTLLERGILRANDIAYLVSEEEKGKSEWKLLWQFPEFNRRQPETHKPEEPTPPSRPERRQKTPPEEIQKKAIADLPPDLMDISPADLLPRSTAVSFKPEPAQISPTSDETLLQDKPENGSGSGFTFDMRWGFGAGVLAMLIFAVVKLPALLRSAGDRGGRGPTAQKGGEGAPTGGGNGSSLHLPPGQVTVHPAKSRPALPMRGAPPPPQPRDNVESSFDSAPPPPPEPEPEERPSEELAQEPAPPEEDGGVPPTRTPRRKEFRPRQPTAEEESGNGPSVESVPASPDGDNAAPIEEDNGGVGVD